MPLLTKRLSEPVKRSDGFRLLITQVKPRTGAKGKERWNEWYPELGPSKELQTAFYGTDATSISWDEFRTRYLEEMKSQEELIDELAELVAAGKTITLVCSAACTEANHCHRTLLKGLVDERVSKKTLARMVSQPPSTTGQ
jgi:uncharacterized protein YeaO (DUF488 family)